jgi:hypothetical protein
MGHGIQSAPIASDQTTPAPQPLANRRPLFGHNNACVRFAFAEELVVQSAEVAHVVSE